MSFIAFLILLKSYIGTSIEKLKPIYLYVTWILREIQQFRAGRSEIIQRLAAG